jgi:hypothetical protein
VRDEAPFVPAVVEGQHGLREAVQRQFNASVLLLQNHGEAAAEPGNAHRQAAGVEGKVKVAGRVKKSVCV